MIPQFMAEDALAAGELVEICPGRYFDINLYWLRWQINSSALQTLSVAVKAAAKQHLQT